MTTFASAERSERVFFGASRPLSLASAYRPAPRLRLRPVQGAFSRYDLLIGDSLPGDRIHEAVQTVESVALDVPFVQSEGELVHVTANVFDADVVERASESALEDGPHTFDSVSARHAAHVLVSRMVDTMLREEQPAQVVVGRVFIGANRGADLDVAVDGVLNFFLRGARQGHGFDATATLTHPENGSLADRAAPTSEFVGLVLVALQSAYERLVNLHDAAQFVGVLAASLAEPLKHEPSRLLSDANFLRELERRDSLTGRNDQIHRIHPLVQRDVGALEDRPGTDGEVQLTGVAAVVAVLAGRDALFSLTLWTGDAVCPQAALKVGAGRFLIGEGREQLEGADSRTAHLFSLSDSVGFRHVSRSDSKSPHGQSIPFRVCARQIKNSVTFLCW